MEKDLKMVYFKEIVKNRQARHNYQILETYEAGIILFGTEIKSLRAHGGEIRDAYIKIIKNELYLIGAKISPYKFGNRENHKETRDRKLLMSSREIQKLKEKVSLGGLTLLPLSLYLKGSLVKIKIALGKGLKNFDKRDKEKKKDAEKKIKESIKKGKL